MLNKTVKLWQSFLPWLSTLTWELVLVMNRIFLIKSVILRLFSTRRHFKTVQHWQSVRCSVFKYFSNLNIIVAGCDGDEWRGECSGVSTGRVVTSCQHGGVRSVLWLWPVSSQAGGEEQCIQGDASQVQEAPGHAPALHPPCQLLILLSWGGSSRLLYQKAQSVTQLQPWTSSLQVF